VNEFRKVKAEELLRADARSAVQLLAHAANGLHVSPSAAAPPFLAALGLQGGADGDAASAFLEVYGCYLVVGCMTAIGYSRYIQLHQMGASS
jgi:hypothetical protein